MNNSGYPETIHEDDSQAELKVTFFPPLYQQRRMWILDTLRAERVTDILEVGCGEGQLLSVLCQPAPWLNSPPSSILPPTPTSPDSSFSNPSASPMARSVTPETPVYNDDGEMLNLHPIRLAGLDISSESLVFAVQGTAAPRDEENEKASGGYTSYYSSASIRWEDLEVKLWKGSLGVVNEEFVGVECIIATEVIEHLPPEVFPAFAPVLLGKYHPRLLLLTTPSYTFNARFTTPAAPPSARRGFSDPTGRTDRVFRHTDHKFEWTKEEFEDYCLTAAKEWGYDVEISSVGRALEVDEWGRDEELGGASCVAIFRRRDEQAHDERGAKAREALKTLDLPPAESRAHAPHELLVTHRHAAHPQAQKPRPLSEIGALVKTKMEMFREAFMRVEELWFERDIAVMCGGWIEFLVRAVEESPFLTLKKEGEGIQTDRGTWVIELVSPTFPRKELWPGEGETSVDHIPVDWIPGEADFETSEGEWYGSTDMEGDVSWNGSDDGEDAEGPQYFSWASETPEIYEDEGRTEEDVWGSAVWGKGKGWDRGEAADANDVPPSTDSSMNGWDGDESDDTTG